MPPIKLSLFSEGDEPDEVIDLDEGLAGDLRATVDASPGLTTIGDAIRQGIQNVIDNGPLRGGGQQ